MQKRIQLTSAFNNRLNGKSIPSSIIIFKYKELKPVISDYACKFCGKIYHTKEGIEKHLEKYCKIKNKS